MKRKNASEENKVTNNSSSKPANQEKDKKDLNRQIGKKSLSFLLALCILILIFGSLIYLNTIDNEFVYDDVSAILKNRDVNTDQTPLSNIFINDWYVGKLKYRKKIEKKKNSI